MTPLPPYEKDTYVQTRTLKGSWYLSSYNYKFNLSRARVMLTNFKKKIIDTYDLDVEYQNAIIRSLGRMLEIFKKEKKLTPEDMFRKYISEHYD